MTDQNKYLEKVYYYENEFLVADDFTAEQRYFTNQFLNLYLYYFSPGIAGTPQIDISKITKLFRSPQPVAANETSIPPISFYLTLVTNNLNPELLEDNYISIDPGFAINSLGQQIVLLQGDVVDAINFAAITTDQAYLTITYNETIDKENKRVLENPVFNAFEVDPLNPTPTYGQDNIYLATVTLANKAIVDVSIDQTLRVYSSPYTPMLLKKDIETNIKNESEITVIKKRLNELELKLSRNTKKENIIKTSNTPVKKKKTKPYKK